jgi:hypothetical protein
VWRKRQKGGDGEMVKKKVFPKVVRVISIDEEEVNVDWLHRGGKVENARAQSWRTREPVGNSGTKNKGGKGKKDH